MVKEKWLLIAKVNKFKLLGNCLKKLEGLKRIF